MVHLLIHVQFLPLPEEQHRAIHREETKAKNFQTNNRNIRESALMVQENKKNSKLTEVARWAQSVAAVVGPRLVVAGHAGEAEGGVLHALCERQ